MRIPGIKQSICLLLVLFLLACARPTIPAIDLDREDNISVFDVFSEVKIIPLETIVESQMADISKVLYHKERYYIFDRSSYSVYCFHQDGHFDFKINSLGNGKGEYLYIADINIDRKNGQLLLLDPILQSVFYYDLDGSYLKTISLNSDENLGLQQVYAMDNEVLMLAGRHHAFVFYSLKEEKFFQAEYPLSHSLPGLFPSRHHVYQLNGRTYGLPPLANQIMDLSDGSPMPWFTFDFGKYNHQQKQIDEVVKQSEARQHEGNNFLSFSQIAGPGRPLHHGVVMVNETPRFRLAFLEFDDGFRNLVIDKHLDKTFVFKSFLEGTILPWTNIQEDRAIAFPHSPLSDRDSVAIAAVGLGDETFNRNRKRFTKEMVSTGDQMIMDSHDIMKDNPYLVIYYFRE